MALPRLSRSPFIAPNATAIQEMRTLNNLGTALNNPASTLVLIDPESRRRADDVTNATWRERVDLDDARERRRQQRYVSPERMLEITRDWAASEARRLTTPVAMVRRGEMVSGGPSGPVTVGVYDKDRLVERVRGYTTLQRDMDGALQEIENLDSDPRFGPNRASNRTANYAARAVGFPANILTAFEAQRSFAANPGMLRRVLTWTGTTAALVVASAATGGALAVLLGIAAAGSAAGVVFKSGAVGWTLGKVAKAIAIPLKFAADALEGNREQSLVDAAEAHVRTADRRAAQERSYDRDGRTGLVTLECGTPVERAVEKRRSELLEEALSVNPRINDLLKSLEEMSGTGTSATHSPIADADRAGIGHALTERLLFAGTTASNATLEKLANGEPVSLGAGLPMVGVVDDAGLEAVRQFARDAGVSIAPPTPEPAGP